MYKIKYCAAVLVVASISWIASATAQSDVPLYDDLGDYHYSISSSNALVKTVFRSGGSALLCFQPSGGNSCVSSSPAAGRQLRDLLVGEALAWGPNINLPMDTPSGEAAFAAIQEAIALSNVASSKERALIAALATRYTEDVPEDRAHLDQAYSDAMAELVEQFPNDIDIAVLYAESLMDLRPWDYWNAEGETQPGIDIALDHLMGAIEVNENHPGACHFYIHAVEEVYPERAVPCAERLANLMPGAGHLVHMPGHIYIRVGRYLDAVEANEHAVHADETYIQDQHPGMGMYTAGYYPHNYDFMAFAAMMIGRSATAIESAQKVTTLLPAELMGTPGMDFLQHMTVRPLQMQVRFARWDDILQHPSPDESYPHAKAIWHYAMGRASLGTGDIDAAKIHLDALRAIQNIPAIAELSMEFNASSDLLAVAERVLSGWIATAEQDYDTATAALKTAVEIENELFYGEPTGMVGACATGTRSCTTKSRFSRTSRTGI